MSPKNHKGYLRIGESLTTKYDLLHTLNVNDVTVYRLMSMRNLKDSVRIFSNRDWPVLDILRVRCQGFIQYQLLVIELIIIFLTLKFDKGLGFKD
jgi:hypothetical protein